uniref:BZIP domain-containing protein n=1 Tax=Kalanchoe fedtschenkoi TaxID=63787 RepID=A0A7N0RIY1_KALFE
MQDPRAAQMPPKPSPVSSASSPFANSPIPLRGSHHRRAHSEASFRLPGNLDLVSSDPYDAPDGSFDEMGSEDDLFCTYMNMDNFSAGDAKFDGGLRIGNGEGSEEGKDGSGLRHHRHSNSVDGSDTVECIEAKKAMAPDKLAELWTVDPKRAKRILANRQSAARSKERKARYILELERKVQTLQTEATSLSAQLTLFQRDTMGLTAENTELKIRLQTLEQQAHLRDALNESLKKEVERLKTATGDTISSSDDYNLGMHHILYNQPSFPLPQHYPVPSDPHIIHMSHLQSRMAAHDRPHPTAQPHGFSEMSQQDSLSRLQGLDINGASRLRCW